MLIKLTGGKVYDPANGVDGEVRDIFIKNGRIVASPEPAREGRSASIRSHGRVMMAGGIDPHSHIGGGKITIARMLLPEDHMGHEVARTDLTRAGLRPRRAFDDDDRLSLRRDGLHGRFRARDAARQRPAGAPGDGRYADDRQGRLRHARLRRFLPAPARRKKRFLAAIKDYIAWTMHASQALAVKVVNPGGISAFKFNQRKLDLDEKHVYYGVTPRDIILTLARGLQELGVRIRSISTAAISAYRAAARRRSIRSRARKACRSISRTSSSIATAPKAT